MDNSSNLYSKDDEFAVHETQESPATFSRNIIKRLGIRRTSSGTDAANPNFNTNIHIRIYVYMCVFVFSTTSIYVCRCLVSYHYTIILTQYIICSI